MSLEVKELDVIETKFLQEYLKNGYKPAAAYSSVRPDVKYVHASAKGNEILKRPHVVEALEDFKKSLSHKVDKNSLIVRTSKLIDKAEDLEQIGAAIRGVELQGKFIGAFESGDGDEEKYVQFITKIRAENVTVVNNLTEDNRKIEVGSDRLS